MAARADGETVVEASLLHAAQAEVAAGIDALFDQTGFWAEIAADPFSRAEWRTAVEIAPTLKDDFYTVLSQDGAQAEAISYLDRDRRLKACFSP